jgi:TolB-like protein/tetratricopeptide (TPR) repeat protein
MTRTQAPARIDLAAIADFPLGSARLRPSLREVAANGTIETLEPRVMQVLVLLAQAAGRTVSRDEMVERCWGGTIVGEDAIQRCIGRLRKLADASGAFEIVTLSRVGYRLEVRGSPGDDAGPERLLAVLPFDNLSDSAGFDYFADGVSEEILQAIARGSAIRVIGRTSSFQFRGQGKIVARMAQELGATHVLDGSVRRSGERLRVSAHLMELGDQTLLWSDRYDGSLGDPFTLQDEVARGVIDALHGVLRPAAPAQPVSGVGLDALMKLRRLLDHTSFGGEEEAVIAAVERLAPTSAEAWGIVAKVRASQRWSAEPSREAQLRAAARAAADRALQIDPHCGAAHQALFMTEPLAGRFLAREVRLERAHAANPEDGELLWSLYLHYLSVGRLEHSASMAEEAYRIDPLRPLNVMAYANTLYTSGLTKQALALMHHAVDRWPNDATVLAITVWTAAVEGEHEFVRALLRADWRQRFTQLKHPLMERAVQAAEGILDDPRRLLGETRRRLESAIEAGRVELGLVGLLAYLGMELDALYDLVDRAPFAQLKDPSTLLGPLNGLSHLFLRVNRRLRESPRFAGLCARLGLCDYWREAGRWPDCLAEVAPFYDLKAQATLPVRET